MWRILSECNSNPAAHTRKLLEEQTLKATAEKTVHIVLSVRPEHKGKYHRSGRYT